MKSFAKPPKKTVVIKSTSKDYDNRPSLSFGEKQLPDIKNWKVGEEYDLTIKVKMTGSSISDYGDDKGSLRGEFKIVSVTNK